MPRTAPLTLMAVTGNGFPVVVAYYELVLSQHAQDLPSRVVTTATNPLGLSAEEVAKRHFHDGQYLWLAKGAPAAAEIFGSPLSSACSYLLERQVRTVCDRRELANRRPGHFTVWMTSKPSNSGWPR